MLSLLDLAQPPTAVFSASDGMAVGALQASGIAACACPTDVALIGYDDLPAGGQVDADADERASTHRRDGLTRGSCVSGTDQRPRIGHLSAPPRAPGGA